MRNHISWQQQVGGSLHADWEDWEVRFQLTDNVSVRSATQLYRAHLSRCAGVSYLFGERKKKKFVIIPFTTVLVIFFFLLNFIRLA